MPASADYTNYFERRGWHQNKSAENFWYYDAVAEKSPLISGKSVLEIGFGDGRFLDWCAAHGLSPIGVEISDAALAKARGLNHKVYKGPLTAATLPANTKLDVVVAFDVIEHLTIHEIRQMIADTLPFLARDGHYLFRFPNGNSPFVGPTFCGDITHRSMLSPGGVKDIVSPLGLVVTAAFNDRMLPPGFLARAKRRWTYGLRSMIEWAICKAYFGQTMPLDPNVFVVVSRDK